MKDVDKVDISSLSNTHLLQGKYTAYSLAMCSTREARELVEQHYAEKLNALPLSISRNRMGSDRLSIAIDEEIDAQKVSAIRFKLGIELNFIVTKADILTKAIQIAYKIEGDQLEAARNQLNNKIGALQNQKLSHIEERVEAQDGEVATFLNSLIEYCIVREASDLHIVPQVDCTTIKIRINGEIHKYQHSISGIKTHKEIINRIKILSRLDISEHFLPQEGSYIHQRGLEQVVVRVSIINTIYGQKAALRIVAKNEVLKLEQLNLTQDALNIFNQLSNRASGMLLCAGATGSGKTTLLYALLSKMSSGALNIFSIEDPIEANLKEVIQTSLNPKKGLDYALALKSILRQDPDVIMLGEIRDAQSAKTAVESAITGHFLLSTIHAKTLEGILQRLQLLGVEEASILQAKPTLVTTLLINTLCEQCKVVDVINTSCFGETIYKAAGCKNCEFSGYQGRVPILDIANLVYNKEQKEACFEHLISSKDYAKELLLGNKIDLRTFYAAAEST